MSQNRSTAVMQRRVEVHDSLDDFPTPPWATRALCEHVLGVDNIKLQTCWEPACNRGYMDMALREYFLTSYASDIFDYGYEHQDKVDDFLFPNNAPGFGIDWIITNPPFRLADQFIDRALELADYGVAVIVRSAFLEGKSRYSNLFSKTPPSVVAQFVERVPMCKGRYDPDISSATSYSWLVWFPRTSSNISTKLVWIPPCRKRLQKTSDAMEVHHL